MKKRPTRSILEELDIENSKKNTERIALLIHSQEEFNHLFFIAMGSDSRLALRASAVVFELSLIHPEYFTPHYTALIHQLNGFAHIGCKRNLLHALTLLPVPEDILGKLIDLCFEAILSKKDPIAVKVYALELIYKATLIYPELSTELIHCIDLLLMDGGAAIQSRGKKIKKRLMSDINKR